MKRLLIFTTLVLVPFICPAALDIRKEVGEEAFKESGLEKLSEKELAALNVAIGKLLGIQEEEIRAEVELPKGEDRFGLESVEERVKKIVQSEGPTNIESTILGEFSGWRGNTVFKLENGQVWRQTDADSFVIKKRADTKVFIRRSLFGGYLLKVEGYNSSCKVERVE